MMKRRYICLTDIMVEKPHREIDDIQSLVRLLLYSNDIEIAGIIPVTSCFLRRQAAENQQVVCRIINAYEKVKPSLDAHAEGYPSAEELRAVVANGIETFGMMPGWGFASMRYVDNPGVKLIIREGEKDDDRPIYIGLWGGANTLAQAIWQYEKTHSAADFDLFLSKLRIYGISDQDYSAAWLRKKYGDRLFYVVTPSDGGFRGAKDYYKATWPGISSDNFEHGSEDGKTRTMGFAGADFSLIDNEWIRKNVKEVSEYGEEYPYPVFITEGDTPSYLWMLPNGLNIPENPSLGGWGGRFEKQDGFWRETADSVIGVDGKRHTSPQASLWRWRADFQADFAMRMQWTRKDSDKAPVPKLKSDFCDIEAAPGETVLLRNELESPEISGELEKSWLCYEDISDFSVQAQLETEKSLAASVTVPENAAPRSVCHIIFRIKGRGGASVVRYARFKLTVR